MRNPFNFFSDMSRVKKKLLLYFILIAIVSISVSAEIILEFSSSRFQKAIFNSYTAEMEKHIPVEYLREAVEKAERSAINTPLRDLRNRMILFLIVVSASIFGAFLLFTKDIVAPMEGMVEATKKIADGDLTVVVPVQSADEIGQIGTLINDMNVNLQEMIMQIRQEIERHMGQVIKASFRLEEVYNEESAAATLESRRIKISDYKKMLEVNRELSALLESISGELFALQKFVKMYRVYTTHNEVDQEEIDRITAAIQV